MEETNKAIEKLKIEQVLDSKITVLNTIKDNKTAMKNYTIFLRQCEINSILNKIVRFVNSKSSITKINPINGVLIKDLVTKEEFDKYLEAIELVNDFDVDLYELSINEIRNLLYSKYDLDPTEIPNDPNKFSVGEALVSGVNPDSLRFDIDNCFMESNDYENIGVFNSYILKGEIYGYKIPEIASKKPKKKK